MSYAMTWEGHGVTLAFQGFVSGAELVAAVRRLTEDERFDRLQFVTFDCSDVTDHSVGTPEVIEEISAISIGCLQTNANIRVLVVTRDERIRKLTALMSAPPFEATYPKHLFESMAEAIEWQSGQPLRFGQHRFRL